MKHESDSFVFRRGCSNVERTLKYVDTLFGSMHHSALVVLGFLYIVSVL